MNELDFEERKAETTELIKIKMIESKPTVTSRIIAEELGKEHKHVIEKIKAVLNESDFRPIFFTDSMNRKQTEYLLDKDAFILLVMNYEGYNDFKRAYIKRFNEMEKEFLGNKVPQTYGEALIEAGKLAIENEQLQIENKKMKPKEIIYDKFMDSEELYEIATVAKMIRGNVGRNKLKKWMKDNKIIMNNNDPYQNHKSHIRIIPKQTPSNKIYMQPFLTTAGVKYILDNYLD